MAVVQNNKQTEKQANPYGVPSDGTLQSGEETQVANQPQNQQVATGQTANIGQTASNVGNQQQNQGQQQSSQSQQSQAPKLGQGVAQSRTQNRPKTSRYQNLQKYISQNQGLASQGLQQRTGQAVGEQAQGFRDTIQQGQQNVYGTLLSEQQRTGQEAQDQDLFQQAQQNIQQPDQYKPEYTFGDISQQAQEDVVGLAQDETNLGRFQQLRDKIVNKAQLDETAIQGGLQNLEGLRGLKEDPRGRANLLRQTFGEDDQQYSQAARNLDSFLLEQDRDFLSGLQDTVEQTIESEKPKVGDLYNLRDLVNEQIVGMGEGASEAITEQLTGQRGTIDEQLQQRAQERAQQLSEMQNTITQKMQYGLPLTEEELSFIDLQEGDAPVLNQLLQMRDPSKMMNIGAKVVGADGREYLAFDPMYEQLRDAGIVGDVNDFTNMMRRTDLGNMVSALGDSYQRQQLFGVGDRTGVLSQIQQQVGDQYDIADILAEGLAGTQGYDKNFIRQQLLNEIDPERAAREAWEQNVGTEYQGLLGLNQYDNFDDFLAAYKEMEQPTSPILRSDDISRRMSEILDEQLQTQVAEEILNQASGLDFSNLDVGQQVGDLSTTAFDGDRILNKSGQQGVVKSLLQAAAPKYDLSKFVQGVSPEDIYAGSVAQEDEIQAYNTLNDLLLGGTDLSKADQAKLGFNREGLTEQYMPEDAATSLFQGDVSKEDLSNLDYGIDDPLNIFDPIRNTKYAAEVGKDFLNNAKDNPLLTLSGMGAALPAYQTYSNILNANEQKLDKALNSIGLGIASDGIVKPLNELHSTISGTLGGLAKSIGKGFSKIFSDENLKENIKDGNKEIEELLDKLSSLGV